MEIDEIKTAFNELGEDEVKSTFGELLKSSKPLASYFDRRVSQAAEKAASTALTKKEEEEAAQAEQDAEKNKAELDIKARENALALRERALKFAAENDIPVEKAYSLIGLNGDDDPFSALAEIIEDTKATTTRELLKENGRTIESVKIDLNREPRSIEQILQAQAKGEDVTDSEINAAWDARDRSKRKTLRDVMGG